MERQLSKRIFKGQLYILQYVNGTNLEIPNIIILCVGVANLRIILYS